MKNDLGVCLGHPESDRVLVGPEGFQTQRPLVELRRRWEIVHTEHHAVYFSKNSHRSRPASRLYGVLQTIGAPLRHGQTKEALPTDADLPARFSRFCFLPTLNGSAKPNS